MNLTTTLLFYLLLGGAVAVAVHLAAETSTQRERWFRTFSAIVFWPLYLPAVLRRSEGGAVESAALGETSGTRRFSAAAPDEIAAAIGRVETELDLALRSLGGWSDAVLAREQHRFEELRAAWHTQADKIRELDRLLGQPAFAEPSVAPLAASTPEHFVHSEQARRENICRLRAVRDRLHDDLLNTLSWVRELVTMIHLARYTGAPASRAEELVMQIATSVEGLSEVAAWRDEVSRA